MNTMCVFDKESGMLILNLRNYRTYELDNWQGRWLSAKTTRYNMGKYVNLYKDSTSYTIVPDLAFLLIAGSLPV